MIAPREHTFGGSKPSASEAVGGSPGGRIYDPLAGRFMSPDPIMQAPYWSQGQNRYSYVFNDPINFVDPSGFAASGPSDWGTAAEVALASPQVSASLAALLKGAGVSAGSLAAGLAGGALNVGLTTLFNPFGGSTGGTYQVPTTGSRAATTGGGGLNAPVATAQQGPPGPAVVQERAPQMSLRGAQTGTADPRDSSHDPVHCDARGAPRCGDARLRQRNKTTEQRTRDNLAWRFRDSRSPFTPGNETVIDFSANAGLEQSTIVERSRDGSLDLGRYQLGGPIDVPYAEPRRGKELAALIHTHPTGLVFTRGDVGGAREAGVPVYFIMPLEAGGGFWVWEPTGGRFGTITEVLFP